MLHCVVEFKPDRLQYLQGTLSALLVLIRGHAFKALADIQCSESRDGKPIFAQSSLATWCCPWCSSLKSLLNAMKANEICSLPASDWPWPSPTQINLERDFRTASKLQDESQPASCLQEVLSCQGSRTTEQQCGAHALADDQQKLQQSDDGTKS